MKQAASTAGEWDQVADEGGGSAPDVLGAYIRAQRQLADMSLRQLAGLSKVSNAYLSQIERGLHQPSLKVLRAISEGLGVSVEQMLAQAGMLAGTEPSKRPQTDVEQAIADDERLSDDEKTLLVGVYRSFLRRPDDASTPPR